MKKSSKNQEKDPNGKDSQSVNSESEETEKEPSQYGVVLKKQKGIQHQIFPQEGVPPEYDTDDYKIV